MENAVNQLSAKSEEHQGYLFGQFLLDVDRGALLLDGKDVPLRPKCFDVLRYLVEHHGVLVSKDQLLDALWADVVVTEDSLTQCLIHIRRALGDTTKVIVRTVPRRGYLFDVPVKVHNPSAESSNSITSRPVSRNRKASRWSVVVVMALTLGLVSTWWSSQPQNNKTPELITPASPTSIAVLPFVDMSPNGDQEYFADGLSEEVLNLLAQSPELQVIARTSSFSFKGQSPDIQTIARKLNVAHIVEGSVRKDGKQIRITAQLVSAANSAHLWSQTYDRTLSNVFAVQSEIAESVAAVLKVKLLEAAMTPAHGRSDPAAYDEFLKGRFFYNRRGPLDNGRAIEHYQKALDIDSGLAEGWVGLAGSVGLQISEREILLKDGLAKIKIMLDKALVLDPDNAEAHVRLSQYYVRVKDEEKWRQSFERALQLGQKSPLVLSIAAGNAHREGDIESAIALQRRAAALDPLSYVNHGNLANYLYFAGYYDEARTEWLNSAALNPNETDQINWLIGLSWIIQEQYVQAEASISRIPPGAEKDQGMALIYYAQGAQQLFDEAVERLSMDNGFTTAIYLAEIYSFQGDLDRSFFWLNKSTDRILGADSHAQVLTDIQVLDFSPLTASIRDDPRWTHLRANLEQIVFGNDS